MARLPSVAVYWLPAPMKLDIEFRCLGARVHTTASIPTIEASSELLGPFEHDEPEYGYLCLEIHCSVDEIDSAHEATRYSRPRYLILLSVLSFLTRHPFSVFDSIVSHSRKSITESNAVRRERSEVLRFVVENTDVSESARGLVELLDDSDTVRRRLLASLLDRWRKALYLRTENDDLLFGDESFLAYFHTLELLASKYSQEQTAEVKAKLERFLEDTLGEPLQFSSAHLRDRVREKVKAVLPLLAGYEIPVGNRISFMLKNLGLLDETTRSYLQELVCARNKIAHGRQVFQEEMVWPMPPFFQLDPDIAEHLGVIEVLSARAIASWVGIDAWKEDWEIVRAYLPPPHYVVRGFLKEIRKRRKPAPPDPGAVPIGAVARYWFRECAGWDLWVFEKASKILGFGTKDEKEDPRGVFLAAVFLSDAEDQEIRARWRAVAESLHRRDVVGYSDVKDVLRELEHRGHRPIWLRKWIEAGSHVRRMSDNDAKR